MVSTSQPLNCDFGTGEGGFAEKAQGTSWENQKASYPICHHPRAFQGIYVLSFVLLSICIFMSIFLWDISVCYAIFYTIWSKLEYQLFFLVRDRLQKSKFPTHCWRNKVVKCMPQSLLNFRWVCCNWLHTPNTERLFFQIELDFLKWYHVWLMSAWKIGPACLKSCTANLWNIRQVRLNFAVIG